MSCYFANSLYNISKIGSLVVILFILLDSVASIVADAHVLMSVSVASLGKSLIAVTACVGTLASVCTYMIYYITQLAETLIAGEALEDLILAPSLLIYSKSPLVPLLFDDLLAGHPLARFLLDLALLCFI